MKKLLGIVFLGLLWCNNSFAEVEKIKNQRYLKCETQLAAIIRDLDYIMISDTLMGDPKGEYIYITAITKYTDDTFATMVDNTFYPLIYVSDKHFVFATTWENNVYAINRINLTGGVLYGFYEKNENSRNDAHVDYLIEKKNMGRIKCEKVEKPKKQI